ncbi:AraC family transcriptional regulator [Sporomusa malonica]|uniref:AraC-type DNA-binding protein n=1 Tax=Sporomusa malonica TaxID=112901 RepID=A0A1W2F2Y7_9FIRM|nr:AraC family transcriptional regulator [Sporomusa malonica]SMD15856.1 AraC-type DNA-binding protein [Sporomusa malonica]
MHIDKEEKVNYWIIPELNNLELLHARYINHSFTKHIHEGFALGVIEQGALQFSYRGKQNIAAPGCINLVIPGEAHDGTAVSDEGWTYRMFYLESKLLEQAVYEISGKMRKIPFFADGVIKDDYMANFIRNFHLLLENSAIPLIEQESILLTMLTEFISRHADERLSVKTAGYDNPAVNLAREYIEATYTQNFSLKELSVICNLSPFHLIRIFKERIGVPPHVYLKQVRIKRAKVLLAKGFSMSFIAQEAGFTDQSHFAKQFKQITGITPKKYSNIIQEISPERAKMK